MERLVKIQDIDQFCEVVSVPNASITTEVLAGVRQLDERTQLEPMLREILFDLTETPHGPTEISDILTTKVQVRGNHVIAAFVLKGKSFAKVRAKHIDHQILRLRTVPNLGLMALVAVGDIQDDARRDFLQVATDVGCDYLIIDVHDCARLLLAYKKICSLDGMPFGPDGSCPQSHKQKHGVKLRIPSGDGANFEIAELRDVSHGGARRLSAKILANRYYDRDILRKVIVDATRDVAQTSYYRNARVKQRWHGSNAHVVWLYLAADLQDIRSDNWLVRTQWIDPSLSPRMRPFALSASEFVGEIAVTWNESYKTMRGFYDEHAAGKGEVLAKLEPLVDQTTEIGNRVAGWFDSFEAGEIDEPTLISRVRAVSPEIDAISDRSVNLPFSPHDVKEYDNRAQSLFGHLGNMALYYSVRGVETWPQRNRSVLMRFTVSDFRADLQRLEFEREKLH